MRMNQRFVRLKLKMLLFVVVGTVLAGGLGLLVEEYLVAR